MKNDFLKKYVNDLPKRYSSNNIENKNLLSSTNKLLQHLNLNLIGKQKKLLDLGSGDGSFYEYCKEIGILAEKSDGSFEHINFEKDKLKFENNVFDFVLMNSIIEHLHNPSNLLIEVKRVLKETGILIVITPNFKYAYRNFYDDPTHVQPYTSDSLRKILKLMDFTKIQIFPFLVNKPALYWKIPFNFFFASIIPFKNHTYSNFPIPRFLRGHSTAMISVCKKKS